MLGNSLDIAMGLLVDRASPGFPSLRAVRLDIIRVSVRLQVDPASNGFSRQPFRKLWKHGEIGYEISVRHESHVRLRGVLEAPPAFPVPEGLCDLKAFANCFIGAWATRRDTQWRPTFNLRNESSERVLVIF